MKKLILLLLISSSVVFGQTITNIVPTKLYIKGAFRMSSCKVATANSDTVTITSETDSTGIVPFVLKGNNQPDTLELNAGTSNTSKIIKYKYKTGKLVLGVK